MLPDAAREVIGKCHPDGEPAMRLLQWEGFRYERVVDIFDGGPLVSCPRDTIRTAREARPRVLRLGEPGSETGLVVAGTGMGFRCLSARVGLDDAYVTIGAETLKALQAEEGAQCLVWRAV
jgi:arginine N-succinyltransferase